MVKLKKTSTTARVPAKAKSAASGNTKTAKKTAPAKKAPSSAPAKKTASRSTAKKTASPRKTNSATKSRVPVTSPNAFVPGNPHLLDPVKDKNKRIQGMSYRQLSELIHVGIGTEQFLVVLEVLRGGASRQEVNNRLSDLLPPTTRNGSPKPIANMVAGVITLLGKHGFQLVGTWQMVRPSA